LALGFCVALAIGACGDGEYASSAHLIHRNNTKPDGAIALDPLSPSPRLLLFRFSDQSF